MTPGSKNLITDIAGIQVGHAADENLRSGVSVIVPDAPAVIAASSLGGGPGTRETDALKPETLVNEAHAVVLAGGSVYGLDAASGVTAAMGLKGGFSNRCAQAFADCAGRDFIRCRQWRR